MRNSTIFIIIVLMTFTDHAISQPEVLWSRTYDIRSSRGTAIVQNEDDNLVFG